MESFSRTSDSKWLSQFGLYRYQSADPKKSKYRQINFIVYGIFGVASIVIFATFFIIIVQSNLSDQNIIVTDPQHRFNDSYNNSYTPITDFTQNDDIIIRDEQLEPLHEDDEHEFIIAGIKNDTAFYEYEGDARNATIDEFDEYDAADGSGDSGPMVEDLDHISAEKLIRAESNFIYSPSRPRRKKKRRPMANRRQFDTHVTYYEPRPFDFELNGPTPASFQKHNFTNPGMTSYKIPRSQIRVNNIQDILNQGEVISNPPNEETSEINRIHFSGTYRHPKRYNELIGIFGQSYPVTSTPPPTAYPTADYYPSPSTKFSSDPFYKYKPRTPSDINLMALNQFRFAPYAPKSPLISSSSSIVPSAAPMLPMRTPTYQPPFYSPLPPSKYLYPINPSQPPLQPSEYENIYHALLNTNHASSDTSSSRSSSDNKRVDGRAKKTKPFSLMLDIYPMTDDESISSGITSTKRPGYRYRRPVHQTPAIYQPSFVNQHNPAVDDHSYFNSITFPQLQQQQRYPLNPYHHQSKHRNNNNNLNINQHVDSNNGRPGQMVVHLNLFPKGQNHNRQKYKSIEFLEERSSEQANENNYDGTYDFQPRNLNSNIATEILTTTTMSLNMGEMLTTISPPPAQNTTTKNFEIIRSIELNATNSNLAINPIVVLQNSRDGRGSSINRNDEYDITELEFIDHNQPSVVSIPPNHKIENCTITRLSNFTIDDEEVMRFEPKDVVMKQSERDYFVA